MHKAGSERSRLASKNGHYSDTAGAPNQTIAASGKVVHGSLAELLLAHNRVTIIRNSRGTKSPLFRR